MKCFSICPDGRDPFRHALSAHGTGMKITVFFVRFHSRAIYNRNTDYFSLRACNEEVFTWAIFLTEFALRFTTSPITIIAGFEIPSCMALYAMLRTSPLIIFSSLVVP